MTKEDGIKLLEQIIYDEVTHQDYKRVIALAEKYYKLKTGDGIEELLHQIETRVTDEEFKQIKKIYKSIIPSTLNSTKLPFQKAARKQPIVSEMLIILMNQIRRNSNLRSISEHTGAINHLRSFLSMLISTITILILMLF